MEELNDKQKLEIQKGKEIFITGVMFIAALLLWNTPVIYPIKLFVVALHELSHGLMAILVGGKIDQIQIDPQIGGYCSFFLPAGAGFFSKFLVAAAGYLGSMLWGAVIFILSARTQKDRLVTLGVAVMMSVISVFVIRTGQWFGIIFCFVFTAFLFVSYKWLPQGFHDIFLRFLGLTSCLYAIIDIKEDLIDRSATGSDADAIAGMLKAPFLSVPIGITWIILALAVLFFTFKISYASGKKTN